MKAKSAQKEIFVNCQFNLIDALHNYKPFDEVEAQHLESIRKFMQDGKNQFSRSNLEGHVTGSGFLMNLEMTEMLMTHHLKLNDWFQFGGHSDENENTLEVAIRETLEESGIDEFLPVSSDIFDVDVHRIPENLKKHEPAHYHYDVRFLFTTSNRKFLVSNESNKLKWFTLAEFKKLKETTDNVRFAKKWTLLQEQKRRRHENAFGEQSNE